MSDIMSLRQYLQHHANNHQGQAKRAEAQALLNVVGDDGKLDGNFLAGEQVDRGWFRAPDTKEKQSNGFTASALNRTVLPWWLDSYQKYRKANEGGGESPGNFPGGGSGGDSSDARERAATIGSYEAEIADINDQMGNVSKLAAGKRAEYEKGYKDAHQGIIDNFNTAEANYGKQEDRTKKSYQDSLGQIDSGASRNYRALMSLAGMYNAGRSSVALKDIPALVSEEASRSRAQVADKYGENMEDITAARAALNASKKKSIEKLEKDKQAGLSEIDTWEKGQNEALLRAKGQAEGNLAMARGGSWSQARQAMAGLQARANQLRSDIAGSKERLYKGYQPAKLEVKEVTPKNYAVDTRGVEKTADGQGADSSTEVQYQEAIKKKRKNEQQLF